MLECKNQIGYNRKNIDLGKQVHRYDFGRDRAV